MKIENSSLDLKSTHRFENIQESQISIHFWNQNVDVELSSKQDELHISATGFELYQKTLKLASQSASQDSLLEILPTSNANIAKTSTDKSADLPTMSDKDKMKLFLVLLMVNYMKGKKASDIDIDSLDPFAKMKDSKNTQLVNLNISQPNIIQLQKAQSLQQGWGVDMEYHELRQESELTSFTTEGIIKMQNGQSIEVSMSLIMSRSTTTEINFSYKAGDAVKDPLVVNFGGGTAELTSEKYDFDIDSDGITEKISFVKSGRGFLALDKNGDNVINDGKELFGAVTGQGFKELAVYDSDNNNWIDENDPIYQNLRIWTRDESGEEHLYTLSSLDIGAIYLGYVDTPFSLKNSDNEVEGCVRSTGIFLRENGQVGTVQQIDLSV